MILPEELGFALKDAKSYYESPIWSLELCGLTFLLWKEKSEDSQDWELSMGIMYTNDRPGTASLNYIYHDATLPGLITGDGYRYDDEQDFSTDEVKHAESVFKAHVTSICRKQKLESLGI